MCIAPGRNAKREREHPPCQANPSQTELWRSPVFAPSLSLRSVASFENLLVNTVNGPGECMLNSVYEKQEEIHTVRSTTSASLLLSFSRSSIINESSGGVSGSPSAGFVVSGCSGCSENALEREPL